MDGEGTGHQFSAGSVQGDPAAELVRAGNAVRKDQVFEIRRERHVPEFGETPGRVRQHPVHDPACIRFVRGHLRQPQRRCLRAGLGGHLGTEVAEGRRGFGSQAGGAAGRHHREQEQPRCCVRCAPGDGAARGGHGSFLALIRPSVRLICGADAPVDVRSNVQ